jgi:protein involved in polysaccharide export with SLBB domain
MFLPPITKMRSDTGLYFLLLFVVGLIGLAAGCVANPQPQSALPLGVLTVVPAESPPSTVKAGSLATNSTVTKMFRNDSARIRPGLVITINVVVAGKNEIEETTKRVSDSGSISLPLLGTLSIRDDTLESLSRRLTTAYGEFFVDPQVIVEFVRDDNREGLSPWGTVTVLGRVKKPGQVSIPATRDLTLSGAIQQAGGFDTSAKDTAIRVTRRTANGQVVTREVNLRAVGTQGRIESDIVLQPDDVVFVPEMIF